MLVNVNIGLCETNNLILDETFVWYYQRAYVSMYVICLLVVIVLYVAVFSAVLRQRNRRQQRRSRQLAAAANAAQAGPIVTAGPYRESTQVSPQMTEMATLVPRKNDVGAADGVEVMVISHEDRQPSTVTVQSSKSNVHGTAAHPERKDESDQANWLVIRYQDPVQEPSVVVQTSKSNTRRPSESTILANLRTAAMLFVVTVVFIVTFTPGSCPEVVTFTPGFLMSLDWLPWNMTIFYLYFANNVANPFIYSFMNQNFRADLRRLVCKNKPQQKRYPATNQQ